MDEVSFTLNGKPVTVQADGDRKLLWVLRTDLGLTGTKYGCGEGFCGACTVVVDREAVRSCHTALKDVAGKEVVTIEGLATDGKLHPLQEAFAEHDALQCGYCTPGMIMNAYAMLLSNPHPSRQEVVQEMEGNLCRCGAHQRIFQAIEAASQKMEGRADERHQGNSRPRLPRRLRHGRSSPAAASSRAWAAASSSSSPSAARRRWRPGASAGNCPATSTPSCASARTAASPATPARSRWARDPSPPCRRCWPRRWTSTWTR